MWVTFKLKSKWQDKPARPKSKGRVHQGEGTDSTRTLIRNLICSERQKGPVQLDHSKQARERGRRFRQEPGHTGQEAWILVYT